METKVEALEGNVAKVTVTIDAKEVDGRIKKAYKNFAHQYNFPGFRKGKAPRPVIDNALGAEAVPATVTDELVNETYPLTIDENNLYPIGKPEFAEDAGLVAAGKPYTFTYTVDVKPDLELSSYDAVEVSLPPAGATEAEIEEQIESLREHYFEYEDATAATKIKEDSFADLAIKATDDAGEVIESLTTPSRLYGLGVSLFPESFDQELLGMKKGQKKSFTIDMPAEPTMVLAPLAGKTSKIAFEVEVISVKNKALPEVTDEWAKDTLGFEDVADLRRRIVESIEQQKSEIIPRMKENQCLTALAARLEGEVPASMCEEAETNLLQDFFGQLQSNNMNFDTYLMQQGVTADKFKEDVKLQAREMAMQDLALDAWARHFGMEATEEDVTAEFVNSGVENPKELEADWRKNGQIHLVKNGILRTQAVKDIMDKAIVKEIVPGEAAAEDEPAKKKPAKKTAAKKTAAKKADAAEGEAEKAEKKPAKKPAAKKAAAKKDEAAEPKGK